MSAGPSARDLSPRERDVLVFLLDRGASSRPDDPVGDVDRARWRAQLPGTRAGRGCGCGTCPSVGLTGITGEVRAESRSRAVLEAWTEGALVLLHVDDEDRLSYLELAPSGDEVVPTFPAVAELRTS